MVRFSVIGGYLCNPMVAAVRTKRRSSRQSFLLVTGRSANSSGRLPVTIKRADRQRRQHWRPISVPSQVMDNSSHSGTLFRGDLRHGQSFPKGIDTVSAGRLARTVTGRTTFSLFGVLRTVRHCFGIRIRSLGHTGHIRRDGLGVPLVRASCGNHLAQPKRGADRLEYLRHIRSSGGFAPAIAIAASDFVADR